MLVLRSARKALHCSALSWEQWLWSCPLPEFIFDDCRVLRSQTKSRWHFICRKRCFSISEQGFYSGAANYFRHIKTLSAIVSRNISTLSLMRVLFYLRSFYESYDPHQATRPLAFILTQRCLTVDFLTVPRYFCGWCIRRNHGSTSTDSKKWLSVWKKISMSCTANFKVSRNSALNLSQHRCALSTLWFLSEVSLTVIVRSW